MASENLSFNETADALEIRIRAHIKYSSLQMESILKEKIDNSPGFHRICDLGCGSGNYTSILASNASLYVGLDANISLLAEAQKKTASQKKLNTLFMQWDMNNKFPFAKESFDFLFLGFSAYYVNEPELLVKNCLDILTLNGEMWLVGPIAGNAKELDQLSKELFDVTSSEEKELRMTRLQSEFAPALNKLSGNCKMTEVDFSLTFPDAKEYARYYKATPQFLELVSSAHGTPSDTKIESAISSKIGLKLTKRSIFLKSVKNHA